MNAGPDVNRYPSVEEFGGYYNIPDQYDDGFPVLRSVEDLPEFGFPELLEVYKAAEKWFPQAFPPFSNQPFDPLAEEPCFVRSDTDDRTLRVDVDFNCLDIQLLRRIQQEFLGRYPWWRVILIGEDPSNCIAIYPTVIRFGNLPADVDPEEALRELAPRVLALREARQRPWRIQVTYLQRQLPDAVRAIGVRPYLLFGVLDNYRGDFTRLTVCLLVRGANAEEVGLEGPDGVGNELSWSPYGVSAEGALIREDDYPKKSPFSLVLWMPPADYRGPLTIVDRTTGDRQTYELKSENILSISPEK